MRSLLYFCRGPVVRGFGCGSKQLSVPTANFPEQVVDNLPADVTTGIYYGWASGESGDVHKTVMSIGWHKIHNTRIRNSPWKLMSFRPSKRTFMEEILNVAIIGYLRPEKNFDFLESFISAIQGDIEQSKKQLDLPEHLNLKEDSFFQGPQSKTLNDHC